MTEDDDGPTDATVNDLPPGTQRPSAEKLSTGRYRIVEELGKGGMGEVLLAIDVTLNREVAIKRMLQPAPSESQIARFLREARVQGRLDHPAIAPVYELSRDTDGRPFFVMKRLTGTTLEAIIDANADGYPLQRLLRAFTEVCHAIELAHSRGVIHRDLKPSNIMLGGYGEVHVLDWGVAKVVGDQQLADILEGGATTMPGVLIGTKPYMPPEQQAGADIDHRIDVYALGCVLFEILVGRQLNNKTSSAAQNRPSVRAPERRIPPELDEIVVGATHLDRTKRTPSARELGDAVQRFLDGDRDLAQRQELATKHLARARKSLGRDERVAMKEAGRALALDPTLAPAADIVGRLMLEPPKHSPPEVSAALRADAVGDAKRQARIAMFSYFGYFLFCAALLAVTPVRAPLYLWALMALLAVNAGLAFMGARQWTDSTLRGRLTIAVNLPIVALSARMLPFVIAPGIAAVIMMAAASNPFTRGRYLTPVAAGLLGASCIAPTVGEWLGWISHTYLVLPDGLMLQPPVLAPGADPSAVLSVYAVLIVGFTAMWAMVRTQREDRVRQTLHVQAWRLRHLIEEEHG